MHISAYFSNFPDFFCQKYGINSLKFKQFFKSLDGLILVYKNTYFNTKFQAVICFRVMTSSVFFINRNPLFFFLDSDIYLALLIV
jgi:hypothetical protein